MSKRIRRWMLVACVAAGMPAQAQVALNLGYVDTAGAPWARFKQFVDAAVGGNPGYAFSATDAALAYRVQGGAAYCQLAVSMVQAQVNEAIAAVNLPTPERPPIAGDSYLEVGPMLRDLALAYDWCAAFTTPGQRTQWADYAEQALTNLWIREPDQETWYGHAFGWSGWSRDDPGNNYYYSFLEATMYWALASNNASWRSFLETQKMPPLVAYFTALPGGGSREGTAYGLSHMRLFELYRLWRDASPTHHDYAADNNHLVDSISWWIHATVPTLDRIAPIGDQARVSYPELYDYHRNVILQARAMATDLAAQNGASWWLHQTSINGTVGQMYSGFNFRHDLLPSGGAGAPPAARWYHATGTGDLFARTGWDRNAMWFSFKAGILDQSHQHQDQGSFTLFARDFLAVTENVFTHSGIEQGGEVHNTLRFVTGSESARQCYGTTSTMSVSEGGNGALVATANLAPAYDGSCNTYYGIPAPSAWTRELRFAKRVLRVTDNFSVPNGTNAVFQLNTPVQPVVTGRNARAGNLVVRVLAPADATLSVLDWRTVDTTEYLDGWKLEVRGSGNQFAVELADADVIFIDGMESATP